MNPINQNFKQFKYIQIQKVENEEVLPEKNNTSNNKEMEIDTFDTFERKELVSSVTDIIADYNKLLVNNNFGILNNNNTFEKNSDILTKFENVVQSNQNNNNSPETDSTENKKIFGSDSKSVNPPPEKDFDYSNIENLDVNVKDLATEGKGFIETSYDYVYEELSKMTPQYKEYIQTQLESMNLEYNEEVVNKYIEMYITQAVDNANRNILTIGESNKPETLRDALQYIEGSIDNQLGYDSEYGSRSISKYIRAPFTAPKTEQAYMIKETADYFLNDEEKNLKFAMKAWTEENSSYNFSDKDKIKTYMDSFAEFIDGYIEQTYGILNPEQRNVVLNKCKDEVLKNLKENKYGNYSLDDALKTYFESCIKIAADR